MRKIFLLVPAFAFVISCGSDPVAGDDTSKSNSVSTTSANNPTAVELTEGTPEAVGQKIVEFVIANNADSLMSLLITPEEMKEVIANSNVMQKGKEAAIGNIPTAISQMRIDHTRGLAEIRKQCETTGIEWSNCKFKSATCEMTNPTGYFMAQMKCVMECNGMDYKFTVTDVVQTTSGEWKLGGTMYYGDVPPNGTRTFK